VRFKPSWSRTPRKVHRKCTPWQSDAQTKLIGVHFELELAAPHQPLARRIHRKGTPWHLGLSEGDDDECRSGLAAVSSQECHGDYDISDQDADASEDLAVSSGMTWYYSPQEELADSTSEEHEKMVQEMIACLGAKRESVLWNPNWPAQEVVEESCESKQEECVDIEFEDDIVQRVPIQVILKARDGLAMNGRPAAQEVSHVPLGHKRPLRHVPLRRSHVPARHLPLRLFESCSCCGKADANEINIQRAYGVPYV
jgi:hypothetical protein